MRTTILMAFLIVSFCFSCGSKSGSDQSESSTNEVDEKQVLQEITDDLDSVKTEVTTETEKTLTEVDSLLNSI